MLQRLQDAEVLVYEPQSTRVVSISQNRSNLNNMYFTADGGGAQFGADVVHQLQQIHTGLVHTVHFYSRQQTIHCGVRVTCCEE